MLMLGNAVFAQAVRETESASCPKPSPEEFKRFCSDMALLTPAIGKKYAEIFQYQYEKRMWDVSCADPFNDNEEEEKQKIQLMWSKYKKEFTCDEMGFSVPEGSILKYAMFHSFIDLIEIFVFTYDLDINFV